MADLSDLQAALTVKIAGSNPSTGVEDNYAEVDSSGNLLVKALLNDASGNAITQGQKTSANSLPVVLSSDQSAVTLSAPSYSYKHVAGAATNTVKSGSGILHTLGLNACTGSTVVTIYDNTTASGTTIAIVNQGPPSGSTLTYDIAFTTGLTIVTAGASTDITVSYK